METNPSHTPLQQAAAAAADLLLAANTPAKKRVPTIPDASRTLRWNKVMKNLTAKNPANYGLASDSIDRMLVTEAGIKLVDDLIIVLKRPGAPSAKVNVFFSPLAEFPDTHEGDAAGYFTPGDPNENAYDIYICWQKDAATNDIRTGFGLRKAVSFMAHTVFHELLHVWFIHAFEGQNKGTGHAAAGVEPEFKQRMNAIEVQLREIETSQR